MGTLNKWLGLVVIFLATGLLAMENDKTETKNPDSMNQDQNAKVDRYDNFTMSMKLDSLDATQSSYEAAVKDAEQSKNPIVFHIVRDNNPTTWKSITDHAVRNKVLKLADVLWVVEQYATQSVIDKTKAQAIFDLVVIKPLKEKSKFLISLLTENYIDIPNSFLGSYSYSRKEKRNVLAEIVERYTPAYLKAFEQIIAELPIGDIENMIVMTREVYVEKGDKGYFDYIYKPEQLNLVQWLMVDKGLRLHANNTHLVNAARLLIARKLAENSNEERDIKQPMFEMVSHLLKAGLIKDEINQAVSLRLAK